MRLAFTFVFILSPDSVASEVCGKEAAHAVESKKRIIPIVCRPVGAAEVKAVEPLAPLVALNWIFMRESDDFAHAFEQLRFALDTDLDYWHLSSDLLVRAKKWEGGAKNANLTLRGPELASAEQWLSAGADKEPRPTALQLDFITASRKVTNSRQRRLLTGVSAALIVTLILAIVSSALFQQTRTQNGTIQSQNSKLSQQNTTLQAQNASLLVRALAGASSDALHNNSIDQALLLSAEAFRRQQDAPEARNALFNALEYSPYLETILQGTATRTDSGRGLAFSKDGQILLSGSNSGQIILWDMGKKTQRSHFTAAFSGCHDYSNATLSPDGQTVATLSRSSCSQAGVDLWNAQTGTHLAHLQLSHPSQSILAGLAFSPDGTKLAAKEGQGVIGIWDVASRTRIQQVSVGAESPFPWLAISPDGSTLAAGNARSMVLWNLMAGTLIRSFSFLTAGGAFSPDGKTLALARHSDIAFLDIASGTVSGIGIQRYNSDISSVAYSPDGNYIVFNDQADVTLQLWDVADNVSVGAPLQAHADAVVSVVASPDGRHFASIGGDNKVVLWRFVPSSARSLQLGPSRFGDLHIAFSPDGKLMATCGSKLTLWKTPSTPIATLDAAAGCGGSLGPDNPLGCVCGCVIP